MKKSPIILCILDGFGCAEDSKDNAISLAHTPYYDKLLLEYPNSKLITSGLDVGLPEGQMGNSEVGHMSIGSGRVIMQDLPKINEAFKNNKIASDSKFVNFLDSSKNFHIIGLLSDGGVHSHIDHIINITNLISKKAENIYLHLFLDGRDSPPSSASKYINQLLTKLPANAKVATISGRYYSMDRDQRFDKIALAYNAIILGQGLRYQDIHSVITNNYLAGITDEFVVPTIINDYHGANDGDSIFCANFRSDRVRQILESLLVPDFDNFDRQEVRHFNSALGMVEYSEKLNKYIDHLFANEKITNTLPEIIAQHSLKQLRIAETEKYAHVTFFFSAGREKQLPFEERILVPSKHVATYDLAPEMSAHTITEKLIQVITEYDFIVVNYANSDMVGHTGNLKATIQAIEVLDECLSQLVEATKKVNGIILITADHGNAEKMLDDKEAAPYTAHTLNKVPLIIASNYINKENTILLDGRLSDIAPTILNILKINQPIEMTGVSLIKNHEK